ncbi:hypothetical protein HJD18_10560 [Thermoleophilia bacterium SCSIO 60948]|nr:hypothetical protein HJD18_10560 [Thermoleophilia bacterium SCSIO 60948]
MGQSDQIASVDGEIGPAGEATLALPDDGLFRGDGVFEVLRVYAGRPFALADHLRRLEESGAKIDLEIDRGRIEAEVAVVLERVDDDRLVRIVSTRAGRRLIFTEPMPRHPETIALEPVTYSPTVILDGVKSISYAANMHATRIAKRSGASDALLVTPDGTVLESPTSSVFWVAGGEIRTPSLDLPILDSITRRRLLGWIEASEGTWKLDELLAADEVFIASTTREVHAVERVGETTFGAPGPLTTRAANAFAAGRAAELGVD